MKTICLFATNYALLQILLFYNAKDCVFFCDNLVSDDVYLRLKKYSKCYRISNSLFGSIVNRFNIYKEVFFSTKECKRFLCQDHLLATNILWKKQYRSIPLDVLEDGTANYEYQLSDILEKSTKYNHLILGIDERVNKIYLSGYEKIPEFYDKNKVEKIDIHNMWLKCSKKKQDVILNVFCVDTINFDLYKGCNFCLITQCFSGSGDITDYKQIEIYSNILKHYDQEQVVIKPHPNDYIDYKKIFPKTKIFPKDVPFELFYYIFGHQIGRYITISSSSAYIIPKNRIDKYDFNGDNVDEDNKKINETNINVT